MMTVGQIGRVYVKATQFLHPSAVDVDVDGIRHDRAFALLEADGGFVPSQQHADFLALRFDYDASAETLRLHRPDSSTVEGPATANGAQHSVDLHGLRRVQVREVSGPWAEILSNHAGRPMRLVRCLERTAIDVFPITFFSRGSLERLAQEVGAAVDPARFRGGFVIENVHAHEEDSWDGRQLRLGSVLLKVRTAVPRCAITGMNPASGARDQDVMRGLIRYRPKTALPDGLMPGYATPGFATYAEVVEPGRVQVGDPVDLVGVGDR